MMERLANLRPWEEGVVIGFGALILMVFVALVWRALVILIGEDLATIVLAVSVLIGVMTWFYSFAMGLMARRTSEAEDRRAEEIIRKAAQQ